MNMIKLKKLIYNSPTNAYSNQSKKNEISKAKRAGMEEQLGGSQIMRFDMEGRVEVFIDASDLKYEKKLEEIQNDTTLPTNQKVVKAKEFATELANEKLGQAISAIAEEYGVEITTEGARLSDVDLDRINWEELVTKEPDEELSESDFTQSDKEEFWNQEWEKQLKSGKNLKVGDEVLFHDKPVTLVWVSPDGHAVGFMLNGKRNDVTSTMVKKIEKENFS